MLHRPATIAGHSPLQATSARDLGLYEGAVPTRTWKPGKLWVAGDGMFPKNKKCLSKYAPFESALEALAHLHLSTDDRIRCYVCQPPPIHYWIRNLDGGQDKREYTPDFVALTRDERLLVIDVKTTADAEHEKWNRRVPHIRTAYRIDHQADFIVWSERELRAEPRLSNARTLYRHRHAPADLSCEVALLRNLRRVGGSSKVGHLCDEVSAELTCNGSEVFSAIMRGVLDGKIVLAPDVRYNRDTEVQLRGLAE